MHSQHFSAGIEGSKEADARQPKARTDALGDPLPAGAIARLGTVRLRHGSHIDFLAFMPDGKRLVSKGNDGLRLWDAATGKELRHLAPNAGWRQIDLSPDGKLLAVDDGSSNGSIHLWDVDSGAKVHSFGEKTLAPVCFSPDGKLLATSSQFNGVELWDAAGKKKLRSWRAHDRMVWTIAFSADSRKLLTNDTDRRVCLWETETGRKLQDISFPDRKPFASSSPAALSPDGKLVAMIEANEKHAPADGPAEWKARITIWDAATGKQTRQLTRPSREIVPGQAPAFRALAFTPDSKRLITSGPDSFLRIWEPRTGEELRRLPFEGGPPIALTLSRDGKTLAAVVFGGTAIRVLDLPSGKATTPPGGHLMGVHLAILTPDGRTAVTGGPDNSPFVWDVATGRLRRRLEGHNNPILSLQLASDGRTLFTSGWDKMLRVWDLPTGEERRRVPVDRDLFRSVYGGLIVTPDDKTVVMVDPTQTIRILDAATGAERQHFQGPQWMHGMGLTPDGRSLVGWSDDCKVRIWDVATGRKLREYPLPQVNHDLPTESNKAALSPDGRLLAIGHSEHPRKDGKERRFLLFKDLAAGRDVRRIDGLAPAFGPLAFSLDGRMLAWTTPYSPVIHLLEVSSGRERHRLAGHRGQVNVLAFTPDGARLISGSKDTTALVWDLRGGPGVHLATVMEREALWTDLAGDDAARAYRAIRQLAAAPAVSVPFLRQRVHPSPAVDEKRLNDLIAALDSDDFATRQKAFTELDKLGEQPLAAYRKVLEGKPSIETRRRIEELREKAELAWWNASGERLRALRAVEALELAGTKEAREALKPLAGGTEGARLTEQAKAVLGRLLSRGSN